MRLTQNPFRHNFRLFTGVQGGIHNNECELCKFEDEILTYEQLNNEHIVLCSLRHNNNNNQHLDTAFRY